MGVQDLRAKEAPTEGGRRPHWLRDRSGPRRVPTFVIAQTPTASLPLSEGGRYPFCNDWRR